MEIIALSSMEIKNLDNSRNSFNMSETNVFHENKSQNVSNSEDILHYEQSIVYVLLTVMLSVLSLVGILGNIPVLIVFCRRKDRKASNTFIKVLAFLDLMVCVFVMPYSIVYEYHLVTSDVTCRLFEFLIHFTIASSNITLVAIATERYIAVCQISKRINVKTINKGMFGILIISVLIAVPSIGTFAVVNDSEVQNIQCSYPHEKTSGYFCHFTFTVMGRNMVKAYQIMQMSVFFVELIAIIVLYSIIYGVLWKKTQIRKSLTRHRESCVSSERHIQVEESLLIPGNNAGKQGTGTETLTEGTNSQCEDSNDTSNRLFHNTDTSTGQNDRHYSSGDVLFATIREKTESKVTFQNSSKINVCSIYVPESDSNDCSKPNGKARQSVSFEAQDKIRPRRSYHRRTAKMLFLCTVVYFVTWMPFWIDIFGLTNSLLFRYVFFIGHATNPIIYGIVNKQVRAAFKRLFLDCLKSWCKDGTNSERPSNTDNVSFSGTSV